jgi:hypothetical protein
VLFDGTRIRNRKAVCYSRSPFLFRGHMELRGVIYETSYLFGGDYPDVPLAPGIDFAELTKGDTSPVFVTLPIGKVGAKSRNGRTYNQAAVKALEEAIQQRRITGGLGHLKDEDRSTNFAIPVVHWVGAKMETDGTLWGKGYIPTAFPEVREYVELRRRTRAAIGTSLYGLGQVSETGEVTELDVEQLDVVDPARVGVPIASAVPMVTAEMIQRAKSPLTKALLEGAAARTVDGDTSLMLMQRLEEATEYTPKELNAIFAGKLIPSNNRLRKMAHVLGLDFKALKELGTDEADTPNNEINPDNTGNPKGNTVADTTLTTPAPAAPVAPAPVVEETADVTKLRQSVRELTAEKTENATRLADLNTVVELLGKPEDVVLKVQNLLTETEQLKRENAGLLVDAIKSNVAEKVKVETARPLIETMVKQLNPVRKTDVSIMLDQVLARPEVKEMLRLQVQQEMGPNQTRPNTTVTETENTGESGLGWIPMGMGGGF